MKLLEDVFFNGNEVEEKNDVEKLDLGKDEDYAKFNKYVDECKKICDADDSKSNLTRVLFETIFGFDMKDIVDDLKKAGDEIHEQAVKERKKEEKKVEKKVPELPSSKCTLEQQSQIHKLVTEYVDTIIRPHTNMSDDVINDAYAGLFEFACWVLKK